MARLNFCGLVGSLLSIAAVVLLIFAEIATIRDQVVPRHLRFVSLDLTDLARGLGTAENRNANLTQVYGDPNFNNFTGFGSGLRTNYQWGLWNDCYGYDGLGGSVQCNDSSFGFEWRPYDQLLFHVPSQYNATLTRYISNDLTFADSDYLGRFSRASFYLIFIGTILAGITMVVALIANRWAFLFGAFTAWLSFLVLVVGAIIWTVIIARVRDSINGITVTGTSIPLGIYVDYGNALWITWGAAGAMLLSIVPLMFACCTGRGGY